MEQTTAWHTEERCSLSVWPLLCPFWGNGWLHNTACLAFLHHQNVTWWKTLGWTVQGLTPSPSFNCSFSKIPVKWSIFLCLRRWPGYLDSQDFAHYVIFVLLSSLPLNVLFVCLPDEMQIPRKVAHPLALFLLFVWLVGWFGLFCFKTFLSILFCVLHHVNGSQWP